MNHQVLQVDQIHQLKRIKIVEKEEENHLLILDLQVVLLYHLIEEKLFMLVIYEEILLKDI